jgi:hypothetical protein
MTRPARLLVPALLSMLAVVGPAGAAGPWRGQVVDAETGQPLEGVVVLAVWDKLSPGVMHPRREYHDVDEVVTDADGRFVIPERRVATANPFVNLDGPNLHMFKPGYGRWRDRGLPKEFDRYDVLRLMEKQIVTFELPPLKSLPERRKRLPSPPSNAPFSKIPRFMNAIEEEALRIGLPPLRRIPPAEQP